MLFTDWSEGRMITQAADVSLVLLDGGHCALHVPALGSVWPHTPGCWELLSPEKFPFPSLLTHSVQQTFGLGALGRVSLLGSPFQWFVCFSFPAFPLPALGRVQKLAVTYLPSSCSLSLRPPRSCSACCWGSLNFSFVSLGMQHVYGGERS